MSYKFTKVIDPEKQIFLVHNAVLIQLPGIYRWYAVERNIDDSKYTSFLPLDDELLENVTGISVVDASHDPEEPDVSLVNEENLGAVNDNLHAAYIRQFHKDESILCEWEDLILFVDKRRKFIYNRMTYSDGGSAYNEIMLRQSMGDRKYTLSGGYKQEKKAQLHKLFVNTIISVRIVNFTNSSPDDRYIH